MTMSVKLTVAVIFVCVIATVCAEGPNNSSVLDNNKVGPPQDATTTTIAPSTSIPPEMECALHNASCEECVRHAKCYYCNSIRRCLYNPFSNIIASLKDCELGDIRWGVCWLNFKALIVGVSVTGGVLLISLMICICCCCRRKRSGGKYARDDAKREREREERRIRSEERRNERNIRNDEIRRKYGLIKDEHPYHRFDA